MLMVAWSFFGISDGYITSMTQTWFGTPMITVNYPNSKTKSFDLQSFYFGCQIQALPSSCFVGLAQTSKLGYSSNRTVLRSRSRATSAMTTKSVPPTRRARSSSSTNPAR